MTEWEPATDAEVAMRNALRTDDQESYFRILAGVDLLLPVSADALAGRAPMGWGTWSTGGRTHVLAFTSSEALQACLSDYTGSARRVPYAELAETWPNLEWWLAVNPGLPIEGYLPAWFVAQLSRGDLRLPTRGPAREGDATSRIKDMQAAALAANAGQGFASPASGGPVSAGQDPTEAAGGAADPYHRAGVTGQGAGAPGSAYGPAGPTYGTADAPGRAEGYDAATSGGGGAYGAAATSGGGGGFGAAATSGGGGFGAAATSGGGPSGSPGSSRYGDSGMPGALPSRGSSASSGPGQSPGGQPPVGPGGLPVRTPGAVLPSGLPSRVPATPPGMGGPGGSSTFSGFTPPGGGGQERAQPPESAAPASAPAGSDTSSASGSNAFSAPGRSDASSTPGSDAFLAPGRSDASSTPGSDAFLAPGRSDASAAPGRSDASAAPGNAAAAHEPGGSPVSGVTPGSALDALAGRSGTTAPAGSPSALESLGHRSGAPGGQGSAAASSSGGGQGGVGDMGLPPLQRPDAPLPTRTPMAQTPPLPGHIAAARPADAGAGTPGSGVGGGGASEASATAAGAAAPGATASGATTVGGSASGPAASGATAAGNEQVGPGGLPRRQVTSPSERPASMAEAAQALTARGEAGASATKPQPVPAEGAPDKAGGVPRSSIAPPVIPGAGGANRSGSSLASDSAARATAITPPGATAGSGLPTRPVPASTPGAPARPASGGAPATSPGPAAAPDDARQQVAAEAPARQQPSGEARQQASGEARQQADGEARQQVSGGAGRQQAPDQAWQQAPDQARNEIPSTTPGEPVTPGSGYPQAGRPEGTDSGAAGEDGPFGGVPESPRPEHATASGDVQGRPPAQNDPASPRFGVGAAVDEGDFLPANEVERDLYSATLDHSNDAFLSTLLLATVLVPVASHSRPGSAPGEAGFVFRTEDVGDDRFLVVFTSRDRLGEHYAEPVRTVAVRFVELIRNWPDASWSFAVNPGSAVGARYPGPQVIALANWALEAGLGDDPADGDAAGLEDDAAEDAGAAQRSEEQPAAIPTTMQKMVPAEQVDYYLERGYDRVAGFVHRAAEVEHLRTPGEIFAALGLLYDGSPYQADAKEAFVLRWPAYRPSLYRIPYGGQSEQALRAMDGWVIERPPFRGNGFAPGEGSDVIAEFKVDSVRLPHGAQLWRVDADGGERVIAIFDCDAPMWRKVGEDDA
ncbi:SseB family protein [Couchioplanes azureus]|uniref:SseB family protein n=1 Tax=Couchioplanes caeruleus TaxID=56438 RepID=UPI001E4125EC